MKRLIFLLIFSLAFIGCDSGSSSTSSGSNHSAGDTAEGGDCVWVDPYNRSDGTCVRGHWKSSPGKDCSLVGSEYEGC